MIAPTASPIPAVAIVGDRGMVTSARIAEELRPAGLDWISCLKAPQIAALAEDHGPLQMSLFEEHRRRVVATMLGGKRYSDSTFRAGTGCGLMPGYEGSI